MSAFRGRDGVRCCFQEKDRVLEHQVPFPLYEVRLTARSPEYFEVGGRKSSMSSPWAASDESRAEPLPGASEQGKRRYQMNVRRVFGILALAMTAVAVSACGNYVNDQTGDDYGIEVATQSLVTNMSYENTLNGTIFRWTSDGSTQYRVQVPGHFVTVPLGASTDLNCPNPDDLCETAPLPVPYTYTNRWYVQGSIDAPLWAGSAYAPTVGPFQPLPTDNLAYGQLANKVTFRWDRSEFAKQYRLQVVNHSVTALTPAEANCESSGPCTYVLTMPNAYSNNWYVQVNGTGPNGPWVGSTFTVAPTSTTLPMPTGLAVDDTPVDGVVFSWAKVTSATHYRLQVPNRWVILYTADEVGCGPMGGQTCSKKVQLPASSGTWYVQAKYIDLQSDPPIDVASLWAGAPYVIEADACAAALPTGLAYEQAGAKLVFSWASVGAVEYKLQVVNNFVITLQAADICAEDVCSTAQPVKAGSGSWYVQARGYCAPYEAAWTNWIGSTYVIEYPDCSPTDLVISQIYTAGGNTNAYYDRDFVELHNRSAVETINLAGMSLQQASGSGTNWALMELTGTIPPGGYFLVGMVAGTNGIPVPTPDLNGTLGYGAASGKAALVSTTAKLPAEECPTQNIIDFISYGTASACDGSPTGALSTTTSAQRNDAGCIDTDNNLNDFTVGDVAGAPRNSSTARVHCGCN